MPCGIAVFYDIEFAYMGKKHSYCCYHNVLIIYFCGREVVIISVRISMPCVIDHAAIPELIPVAKTDLIRDDTIKMVHDVLQR